MGIIGSFKRRDERDRLRRRHPSHPKHRLAPQSKMKELWSSIRNVRSNATEDRLSLKNTNHEAKGSLVHVDNATSIIIEREVQDLLQSSSDHSCTALSVAVALSQSQACLESHSKVNENYDNFIVREFGRPHSKATPRSRSGGMVRFEVRKFFPRKSENESMKSRYEWMDALNRLQKHPSSRDKIVSSWKEAKVILEEVLGFPPAIPSEERKSNEHPDSSSAQPSVPIAKKHANDLQAAIQKAQEKPNTPSFSGSAKWKQIVAYPDEERSFRRPQEGDQTQENEDLEKRIDKLSIDKADLYFNARLQTSNALNEALRKESEDLIKELEERKKADDARKRALSLMRTLDSTEREIVQNAIYGRGNENEIIAQAGADSVQRASMKTLKPGSWVNDEIIHYFYLMLAKRDEEMCMNDPSRKRSHFFKSFFITKLLNEGNASCDGKYEYRNVKRWSKKVPGKDIFQLDKILFPINMGNMHWICAAIFMNKKRIEVFDSMGAGGNRYLDALFNYIQDEHLDKKKSSLPDKEKWELVPTQRNTPRQTNGYDCGVFTCMFADFLSKDTALVFSQQHINQCRERIALSIMKGKAIM
mmetsp:Transcript_23082/g.63998  ORF Transcript_23082/g.63998 Transcript_23082/m.63998 type:complete len:588 (+) Transcript_23082:59-1822(+)